MGLFDGAFGNNGNGILPDWLFNPNGLAGVSPDMMAYGQSGMQPVPMPVAQGGVPGIGMTADMPFADRWRDTMQAATGGVFDPQGGNNNMSYASQGMQTFPNGDLPMPQPRPPQAQQAYDRSLITPGLELPPEAAPTVGQQQPSNPFAGLFASLPSLPSFVGSAQAQPTQAQGGSPQQEPGFGDRMLAGILGFGNSGAPIPAIANLIGGLATGQRTDPTAMALKRQGQSSDIAEYEFSRGQGDTRTFAEWMKAKRLAGAPKAGLQPIVDAEGNIFQLTSDGELIKPKGSENFKINKGVELKDTGTHWQPVDRVTGKEIGKPIPKNIEGREAAEERGKATGQAQVALPNVIAKAEQSIKLVDEMIKHPGRETSTGLSGTLDPRNYLPGTSAKDFQVRQKQLQGRSFLEAFESLKGGGAISEVEGAKAEQAIARLDRSQSDEEYVAALRELRDILQLGMQRARQKAQGNFSPEAPAQQTGPVEWERGPDGRPRRKQ